MKYRNMLTAALLTASLSIYTGGAIAQPAIQWQKTLGGAGLDRARSIQSTADGGYIVAGYTESNNGDVSGNHGGSDCWIVKLDNTGAIQWQKALGGSGDDGAHSVQPVEGGGYIVAGYTESNNGNVSGNHGGSDFWVVKLSNTGNIEWQKTLGGSNSDGAYSIQPVAGGGYIVAGYTASNDGNVTGHHGAYDYWVVKLNNSGGIEWQKALGGISSEMAYSIQPAADGGYIVAGYSTYSDGDVTDHHAGYDYWVVKLNNNGDMEWQKALGGDVTDIAQSVLPLADGGFIVAGYSESANGNVTGNHGGTDFWVVRLNDGGRVRWQKSLGGSGDDQAYSVQPAAGGGFIVAGYTTSNNGDNDCWVVKLNNSGDMEWQKTMGNLGTEQANSIQTTVDGGYIVAGFRADILNNNNNNFWVAKLATDPALPVTFGAVTAAIKNNTLLVNFTSLTEVNNHHFVIEASTNSRDFKSIGTLLSAAQDGNSDVPLHYHFSFDTNGWGKAALAGVGCFLLLLLTTRNNRKLFAPAAIVCAVVFISCNKTGETLWPEDSSNLYIRIMQVDKDGAKSYSKVIKAVKE